MTMRARVQRQLVNAGAGDVDDYGNPAPASDTVWETKIDGLACWFWSTNEREAVGPDATKVVEDLRMIVPRGSDIAEQDRVLAITDRMGAIVRQGPLGIDSVVSHRDHLELVLVGIT